ncbi:MAG: ribbon-helix-helix protein, CopG family [Chloroflexota bacterium]
MNDGASARRWPLQVCLTAKEIELLESVAQASGQTKSDVVREALRRLERELIPAEQDPAWELIGLAGNDTQSPEDMSIRPDDYLVEWERDTNRPR